MTEELYNLYTRAFENAKTQEEREFIISCKDKLEGDLTALKTLKNAYPIEFLWWVLAAGVSITAGTVLYLFGHRHRYFHSVFHLAVDLGAVLAFIGIFKFCIV